MSQALLTDLYQLTMLQAYLDEGLQQTAVFELFVRTLPPQRRFLVAAGLEQALDALEHFAFADEDLRWLAAQQRFSPRLLEALAHLRFEGDVDAMPEGTVFFAEEPILRITAPLPQAQIVESRLLNLVHFQTLIASKATRVVSAAGGRQLVDFGMRRAHGEEAAVLAARAAFLAGFDGTATAEAGRRFGIPTFGTMAHSFVQAHPSEQAAFEAFMRTWPQRSTLLVDTYDTEAAVARIAQLAPAWRERGMQVGAVRLDSGDLAAHAHAVRGLLDAAGLRDVGIFASGNLDELRVAALLAQGAPITGFGVGTALDTSGDLPALDAVYKLQSYAGQPRRKRSEGKATWPGIKQVCRQWGPDGRIAQDVVQLASDVPQGTPLLQPCMRGGRRLAPSPPLAALRQAHARERQALPPDLLRLDAAETPWRARIAGPLRRLAHALDEAGARAAAPPPARRAD